MDVPGAPTHIRWIPVLDSQGRETHCGSMYFEWQQPTPDELDPGSYNCSGRYRPGRAFRLPPLVRS